MTISRQRLKKIEAIRDEDIDYSGIPKTDAAFWAVAELRMPQTKKGVYLRLDQDVLEWLKAQGPQAIKPGSTPFCVPIWTRISPRRDQ